MNALQKGILIVGTVAVVGMGLYPPWTRVLITGSRHITWPVGYSLITNPPPRDYSSVQLDTTRLAVQEALAMIATAVGMLLGKSPKIGSPANPIRTPSEPPAPAGPSEAKTRAGETLRREQAALQEAEEAAQRKQEARQEAQTKEAAERPKVARDAILVIAVPLITIVVVLSPLWLSETPNQRVPAQGTKVPEAPTPLKQPRILTTEQLDALSPPEQPRVMTTEQLNAMEARAAIAEEIYSACDKEFGAQYRNEAIARADQLVDNGKVDPPRTQAQALLLLRKCYAEVQAMHKREETDRPSTATSSR